MLFEVQCSFTQYLQANIILKNVAYSCYININKSKKLHAVQINHDKVT